MTIGQRVERAVRSNETTRKVAGGRVSARWAWGALGLVAAACSAGEGNGAKVREETLAVISSGSTIDLSGATKFQTVLGFGVNGQPRNWGTSGAAVKPALSMLVSDLNATIWRVEINQGLSNWEMTNDNASPSSFNWTYYDNIFANNKEFQNLWAYIRHLNSLGITNIELAAHGNTATWLGVNHVSTALMDEYVETLLAVLEYATVRIPDPKPQFRWFSPFNEGDQGGTTEGVGLTSTEAATVLKKLATRITADKATFPALGNVRLITPELSNESGNLPGNSTNYRGRIVADSLIKSLVDGISHHTYSVGPGNNWNGVFPTEWVTETNGFAPTSGNCAATTWEHAVNLASGTINLLKSGVPVVLVWTEYDAPHSHSNDRWETFGLLETKIPNVANPCTSFVANRVVPSIAQLDGATYTPKLTYGTFKQITKFVQPNAVVVQTTTGDRDLNVVGLQNPDNSIVIVGKNNGVAGSTTVHLAGLPVIPTTLKVYYTTSTQAFVTGPVVSVTGGAGTVSLPADSIFTIVGTSSHAPAVKITKPTASQNFSPAPADVAFLATADADTGRSIQRVDFYTTDLTTPICSATASPYGCTWASVPVGSYTLTVKATDSTGAVGTSSGLAFSVGTAPPPPPPTVSITSPANGATFTTGSPIAISANASGNGGATVSRVDFFQNSSAVAGCGLTASPYNCTFTPTSAGGYSLTAVAQDSLGQATTSAAVSVVVTSPATAVLVGDSSLENVADGVDTGIVEAFRYQAGAASAAATRLSIYLDSGGPSGLMLGLYADANGSPGSLLAGATFGSPVTGWNTAAVASTSILASSYYWIAVLSPSAAVTFVEKTSSSGLGSIDTGSTRFSAMPGSWPTSGTIRWPSSSMSAYADR